MIGDGLSHVAFGALTLSLALNISPLHISLPVVMIAAVLLLRISESSKIKGDAAVAIITSSSLAIGVISASITKGINIDVFNFMFGSILAMSKSDVYLSVALSLIVLTLYIVFHNKIFAVTFDENFAKASGINTNLQNTLIALLTAATIVVGMRIMGALLISSLIVFRPYLNESMQELPRSHYYLSSRFCCVLYCRSLRFLRLLNTSRRKCRCI